MRTAKIKKAFFAAITLMLACSLFFLVAYADEQGESEKMPDEYGDFIGSLPDDVADKLGGAITDDIGEVSDAAIALSSAENIINILIDLFLGQIKDALPTLAIILGVVIISAVLHTLSSSFAGGLSGVIELCTRICTYSVIAGTAISSVLSLSKYFSSLFTAVAAFLPLSATLYAMGGNLTLAATSGAGISVILTVCQFICTYTVIPVFCVCLCLSLTSVFDGVFSFAGNTISGNIKKWYNIALGFVMTLLTTSLATQTIVASRADGVAMRGLKFAAGSFIPISGGAVSSTLGTLASSVGLIRGSVGVVGIIALILMLLPTLLSLAVRRLTYGIAEICAGLLSATAEQKLLGEIGSLYGYLEGVAVLCSAVFIIALAIFGSIASPIS